MKLGGRSGEAWGLLTSCLFFFFFFWFLGLHTWRMEVAVAARLCHLDSNTGFELRLQPTAQLMAMRILNPLSKVRDRICILTDASQIR